MAKEDNTTSLSDWLVIDYDPDKLGDLFNNMDISMKYLHSKDYYVESFSPNNIDLVDGDIDKVKFIEVARMPDDELAKKEYIQSDIERSALLQVGIYFGDLSSITPDSVKENFQGMRMFLPENMASYYAGILERPIKDSRTGRRNIPIIYLSDYTRELAKRQMNNLEKELAEEAKGSDGGKDNDHVLVKSNGHPVDPLNSNINNDIYSDLGGDSKAAYTALYLLPVILAVMGVIISMIILLSK